MMIFLRHPRPDVPDGTCYGQLEIDIHADGLNQIRRAVKLTPPVRRLISSPALRCRELAITLSTHQSLKPEFDSRLLEMHMGEWEGMLWKDIPRSASEPWLRDPYNLACPGGESFRQVQERVLAALENVSHDTAIICHAGPIRAVQMAWHGISFSQAFETSPPYAEPIKLHP